MKKNIDSGKLLTQQVFQKWYRIPEYQRPYVWEDDQIIELLDDIYSASEKNSEAEYFLGSLVLLEKENNENGTTFLEYDVLDGQQRLTTLFLIHAVIRDLQEDKTSSRALTANQAVFKKENIDDKEPERIRIVFDIHDRVKEFVNDYVKKEGGTNLIEDIEKISKDKNEPTSVKNMAAAILTIRKYFTNGYEIDQFFPFLRSNVLLIYVSSESLEDSFHLFTVMNNRGIKLRNSDIIKAKNLGRIDNKNDRVAYAKKWDKFETYFGEDFDNFLSHLRTILVKSKASYNLLREFEENIYEPKTYDRTKKEYIRKTPLLKRGSETFLFIDKYFEIYKELFDEDSQLLKNNIELSNKLNLMQLGFESDLWISPLLSYYKNFRETNLLDFTNLLDRKFSADWISGLTPTKRIENINIILKNIEDSNDSNEIISSDIFNIDVNNLTRVVGSSIYGRKFAKYILLKLDMIYHGHTTFFKAPNRITIEHILPQNPNESSQWRKDFSESDRDKYTDCLGNLVLISRRKNSAQGNLDYHIKKERYFKDNIELFSNSIRIYQNYPTWNKDDLIKNFKETLTTFLKEYDITLTKEELDNTIND